MVEFVGSHPEIEWVKTGLYSLDVAIRKNYLTIGFPTRTLTEVFGETSTGKSTFINSISCIIAQKQELGISCLDLETQDPETIRTICNNLKFSGKWKWVEPNANKKEDNVSDEYLLGLLRKDVSTGHVAILDSVAAISPVAEVKGEIGDANMGRRAYPMAQFSRLMNRELKWAEKGTVAFLANHRYEKFDAPMKGMFKKPSHAPGGVVKENMAHIVIENKIAYHDKLKKLHYGDAWVFEGKVKKNRFGLSNSSFWVFIVGGQGIHVGLTALFDTIFLGITEVKTGKVLYNKNTGEELGRVSDFIKNRDKYNFEEFENMLKAHQLTQEDDAKLNDDEDKYEPVDETEEDE